MRWMRRAPLVSLIVLSLALPAQSLAASIAPPGKSGADQYFETVPTAGGNAAPPQNGGSLSGRGSGKSALGSLGHGRTGSAKLSRLGKTGQAAAALAAATAPAPVGGAGGAHRGQGGLSAAQIQSLNSAPSQSTASALAHLLGGSDLGGLGWVLPLLLAAALVGAAGFGGGSLLRHRSGPPDATA